MKKEDIIFEDMYEEVDEYNAYSYDSHDKIHIDSYDIYYNSMIRVIYWVFVGEIRHYDVKVDDYIRNVRDKKLRKLNVL